jgi:hypothetical protein
MGMKTQIDLTRSVMERIEDLKLELKTLECALKGAVRLDDTDYYQSTKMAIELTETKLKTARETLKSMKAEYRKRTGETLRDIQAAFRNRTGD